MSSKVLDVAQGGQEEVRHVPHARLVAPTEEPLLYRHIFVLASQSARRFEAMKREASVAVHGHAKRAFCSIRLESC